MSSNTTATPLAWGILGTGNTARQFALGLGASRRGVLRAVGSRSDATARSFASELDVPTSFGSYDALISSDDVDAIYIGLPNTLHREWTERALRAGKHVLCEKPFAATVADAEAMFAAAESAGRVLVEGYAYRSSPLTRAVIEATRRGDIGTLRLVRASFCYRTQKIDGNIRFDPALAGGALMDVGCYCVDVARLVAGCEPSVLSAVAQHHPRGVDVVTSGVLQFANGLIATFSCGLAAQCDNTLFLCGDEGYIAVPIPWKPPVGDSHYLLSRSAPPKQDSPGPVHSGPTVLRVDVEVERNVYASEADAFAAVVQDGAKPIMSEADTMGTLRAVCELHRKIQST